MRTTIRGPRRLLAVLAAAAAVAVAAPVAAAPSGPVRPVVVDGLAAPPSPTLPDGARFGDFVEAADAALVVDQPDGSTFKARLTDAEIGGALEVDGYSILKADDGWWRYAADRGPEGLVASPARVGLDARPAELVPGVGRIAPVWDDGKGGDVRAQLLRQLQVASRQASLQAAAQGAPRVFRFPVVLFATWYDPELGQTSPQFQEGNDVAHYQAILDGFGGNPTGTLTEFYFENSYGQFLVEVDVLAKPDGSPYVSTRSSLPGDEGRCYYGGIDPPEDPLDDLDLLDTVIGAGGGGALGMALELFNTTTFALDHQLARYDNDGDSSIDFMGIIHSGAEMAVTGDPCNTWSHAISVSTFTTLASTLLQGFGLPIPDTGFKLGLPVPGQAVTYDRLFTMPEFETRTGVLTIGVAAHEMAHALGEPDYYGTDGLTSGSGDWDVMSGGSYGGTPSGSNPTWFNPTSRVFQGWVTPTVVHEDQRGYTLERRSTQPPGYAVGTPNRNLVLVPTRWVDVGETTDDGHTWTENDVYGLVRDGDRGYVIEGWYLELAGRMPDRAPGIHPDMSRASYFDRWLYGSGLLTWHFDYWRRSNVLFGQNGGNNDPNRMQMDVEEWDHNDNTQEIALNQNRAEASDVAWDAATGITSGTHRPNPNVEVVEGSPQAPIAIPAGPVTPLTPYDFAFQVEANPANRVMRVAVTPALGDCTLQLLAGPPGQESPQTEVLDAGFVGAEETAVITLPKPGRWVARVGDFAACLAASGSVTFEGGADGFDATGTADTWSNDTEEPTGWAFTNIRTGAAEGLSHGTDAGGEGTLTLDIVDLSEGTDVSPGHAGPATTDDDGTAPVNAGRPNPFSVRVFNNGSTDETVDVTVHAGSAGGPVVASGPVTVDAFDSAPFDFTYDPGREGGFDLVAVVDPGDGIDEAVEGNNAQKASGWAGPAGPSVLIVDDDGSGDTERVYAGALAAAGIPYAIAGRHVSAADMAAYEAVIWVSTLDRGPGQLDEDDRAAIEEFLGGGGRMWLSSNRAIEALIGEEAVDFGARWFGVESIDIDSFYKPVRFETEDILGDEGLTIGVLPGRPFVDKYALAAGALGEATSLGVLDGSGTPGDGDAILGARLEGDADGTAFQTVVTSFNLSQVTEPGAAVDMVGAIMDHLGVARGQYAVASAEPLIYHSQLRQTVSGIDVPVWAIVQGGDAGRPVQLLSRPHGIGDYTATPMQPDGAGYLAALPAAAVTPDGIDYYLKAGSNSTYDPRLAASGQVAHAVAVFLPEVAAAPPAPTPSPEPAAPAPTSGGGTRLPATGGTSVLLLATLALAAGLTTRRLLTRT